MITQRQIISGSAGLIFAIFSPNESVFGADDQSGPFFQGTLPWQPIEVDKSAFIMDQSTLHCHSETDCNIAIMISKDEIK